MTRAADFSPAVKEALAKRAGFRCSFPGCEAPTIGPSDESNTSTNSTGMACHIAAASSGGSARRVLPGATPQRLSDITNGIWMCFRHGKLIDADEETFTIPILETWREIAELKAKLRHELGREVSLDPARMEDFRLPDAQIPIPGLAGENALIGDALRYSCLADIWGKDVADAVRDSCIELIRNAFAHGAARVVRLLISASSVTIEDDGSAFNSNQLRHSPTGGGGASLKIIAEQFRSTVIFSCKRVGASNHNTFTFIRKAEDLSQFSPCTVSLTFEEVHAGRTSAQVVEGCDVTYVVLPPYFALSDVLKLPQLIATAFPKREGREVVLVTTRLSAGAIQLIGQYVPHIEIINLGDAA